MPHHEESTSGEGSEPTKRYKCSTCSLSFQSVNALSGHQNAHRKHRNQMRKFLNSNQESNKKTYYYEFMPLKEGNVGIYGYGRGFQKPIVRLGRPKTIKLDLTLKL